MFSYDHDPLNDITGPPEPHDPHNDPIFDPREDEYKLVCIRDTVLTLEHEASREMLLAALDRTMKAVRK
jgi:hypothetical protein